MVRIKVVTERKMSKTDLTDYGHYLVEDIHIPMEVVRDFLSKGEGKFITQDATTTYSWFEEQ